MLTNKASPVVREGKMVGHFYRHAPNNMQAKMAAISYEFLSAIPCPDNLVQEKASSDIAVIYTHTLQSNKSKLKVI